MGERYDLMVVGAGSAGLAAARAAAGERRRVALVDRDLPGGDCTWTGCVPSKALLETSRIVARARTAGSRGVTADVRVDGPAVLDHVRAVRTQVFADESPEQLGREGIEFLRGAARLTGPREVTVDGRPLSADRVVLAVGASPVAPAVPGLADVPHLTTETVWDLSDLPRSLVVLGGGPVGTELAQAFRRLGSEVTLVCSAGQPLPRDDPDAARVLLDVLRREGVDVRLSTRVAALRPGPVAVLSDGAEVAAEQVLVAAGRVPRTDGLGLDAAGVRVGPDGRIAVDDSLRTSAEHVFAVGDCGSLLAFTHVADEQGRLAVGNAFGRFARKWHPERVPWVTYTDPEVAQLGMTEAQAAREHGDRALVAELPMSATDRARCAGETDGFVKLVGVAGPRGNRALTRLVGMTVVAPVAGELLAAASLTLGSGVPGLGRTTDALAGRLALAIAPYPTWQIAVRMAAAQFFGTSAGRTARPAHP